MCTERAWVVFTMLSKLSKQRKHDTAAHSSSFLSTSERSDAALNYEGFTF